MIRGPVHIYLHIFLHQYVTVDMYPMWQCEYFNKYVAIKADIHCTLDCPPKYSTVKCARAPMQTLTAARSWCAETVIWVGMRAWWVSAGAVEAAAESSELWDCGIVSG